MKESGSKDRPFLLTPAGDRDGGRLVVLGFADESAAFALRDLLCTLEEEGVLQLGDAVVVTRSGNGKVRLHQSMPLVSFGTAAGSFTGMLFGTLLLNPLFGSMAGAAAGALITKFTDVGIDDRFMKSLSEALAPGTSALFVLARKTQPQLLLERIKPFAGRCKLLQTELPKESEALLRAALEGAPPVEAIPSGQA